MRVTALLMSAVSLVLLLATLTGVLLPKKYSVNQQVTVAAPVETVWATLTTWKSYPTWRREISSTERAGYGDKISWREYTSLGESVYEVTELNPPQTLVVQIVRSADGVKGSRIFQLETSAQGTTVHMTEQGEIRNPIFRLISKFGIGNDHHLIEIAHNLNNQFQK